MNVTKVLGLFTFPTEIVCDESTLTDTYGKFFIYPLEKGAGVTIANSLRRLLLSSVPGYAISGVKIEGLLHEFSPIEGAKEDYVDFILNLKQVRLRLNSEQERKEIFISLKGEGKFKAGDISKFDSDVVVANADLELLTLNEDADLRMKLVITYGKGVVFAEDMSYDEVGLIPVDAIYSPVKRVNFDVDNIRYEGKIFERAIIEVETDGTYTPLDAYKMVIEIYKSYLRSISSVSVKKLDGSKVENKVIEVRELLKKLSAPIEELNLSAKTFNILKESGITRVYDLVSKHEEELKFRSFGKKSIEEVKKRLEEWDLSIGMHLPKEVIEKFESN